MRGLQNLPEESQFTPVMYTEASLARVPLGRFLAETRRDAVSGLALGPASLALRYLLPVYDLEKNVPTHTGLLQERLDKLPDIQEQYGCHVTGSSIERLAVPPYTERAAAGTAPFYQVSDVDMMVEMKKLAVAPRRGAGLFYMDTSKASHEGYTRVVVDAPSQVSDHITDLTQCCKSVDEDDRVVSYLSIDGFNDWVVAELKEKVPDILVHRQGPAVNVQQEQHEDRRSEYSFIEDQDLVPALPLTEQLPALRACLERLHGRVWPPPDVWEDIDKNGRCLLVGAGHASSQRRDLEWRISFSDPEKRLARSLTANQRKVYVLIKMMQKAYMKEPKVLVTYHLKMLMFWELEAANVTEWEEHDIFQHTLNMLDRIQGCLERHCIPSFFIPANNLLSQASEADVTRALAVVRQIRQQPLQHIYGIDDRFRFDFSSTEPLSELHAPLRELLLAGGAEGAAEALAVSLIRQAGSDIRRGVVVMPRCVDLLRDAWQALAPERGPHPVHDDWIMFAAAASLTTNEPDASAWIMEALRMALAQENRPPPPTKQLTAAEQEVLQGMLGSMVQGEGAAQQQSLMTQIMDATQATGTLEQVSPALSALTIYHAQLELLRDVKNKGAEGIPGSPPMLSAVTMARLNIGLIDATLRFELSRGDPPQVALMAAAQKVLAMGQSMTSLLGSAGPALQSADSAKAGIVQLIQDVGLQGHPLTGELMQTFDQLSTSMAAARANPASLPFETDPRIVNILPAHLVATYAQTLGQGVSQQDIDHRYTPFFNMIGFFLRHKLYLFAFRMTGRMTCLGLTLSDAESERVVYDLSSAPLYLREAPPPVRRLLRLTSCRAALGAIYLFINHVHLMFDRELMSDFIYDGELTKLEQLTENVAGRLPEDTVLTHLVMQLCALRIQGQDTGQCLSRIAAVAGEDVAHRAGHILQHWEAPDQIPDTSQSPEEIQSPSGPQTPSKPRASETQSHGKVQSRERGGTWCCCQ